MNLDEAQRKKVAGWIEEGLKLSDIQGKITSELGITMTYMEVRFLLDDLRLKPKDQVIAAPIIPNLAGPSPNQGTDSASLADERGGDSALGRNADEAALPKGGVSVTVDQVTRPGSLASGKVSFSDGNSADWYLDQMGRLGLMPKQPGYKPSQQDIVAFQTELQHELGRLGM